ncbi:MAG: hypothetical protein JJU37_01665 [Balneolaceae bacterium]|nr:hypothetical protein [Balneolaceae bacterium]
MKKLIYLSAIFLLAFTLTFCSDDHPVGPGSDDLGEVEISVTGDVQTSFEGIADFDLMDEFSINQWELFFNDISPQTFSVQIFTNNADEMERPSEGTYEIGSDPNAEEVFTAIFNELEEDLTDGTEYTTFHDDSGGELVITESSEDVVRGSFTFTAKSVDSETNEIDGEVEVTSGEFVAVQRE